MKKVLLRLLILGLLGFGGWYAYQYWLGLEATPSDQLILYGNVEIHQVELAFRVGGQIEQTFVNEGDYVNAGDVLARLEPTPFSNEVTLAEANLAIQQANLDKALAGSRLELISQAQAQLSGRETTAENLHQTWQRMRNLRGSGGVSQQSVDDAEARYNEALSALEGAREELALLESGARSEDIDAARAGVDVAKANLSKASTALDDATLRAPSNGVILSKAKENGSVVGAGQTIFTLTLSDPVYIRAYVPQPQLGLIKPGMAAQIAIDAYPDRLFSGQVGYISPTAEFTPKAVETLEVRNDLVFRLRILAEDPDNVLRQGMPVTITLQLPTAHGEQDAQSLAE